MRAVKDLTRLCGYAGSVEPWLLANTISCWPKCINVQCIMSLNTLKQDQIRGKEVPVAHIT